MIGCLRNPGFLQGCAGVFGQANMRAMQTCSPSKKQCTMSRGNICALEGGTSIMHDCPPCGCHPHKKVHGPQLLGVISLFGDAVCEDGDQTARLQGLARP
eukprot:93895-Chlamydomonas_euryale.AAC.6